MHKSSRTVDQTEGTENNSFLIHRVKNFSWKGFDFGFKNVTRDLCFYFFQGKDIHSNKNSQESRTQLMSLRNQQSHQNVRLSLLLINATWKAPQLWALGKRWKLSWGVASCFVKDRKSVFHRGGCSMFANHTSAYNSAAFIYAALWLTALYVLYRDQAAAPRHHLSGKSQRSEMNSSIPTISFFNWCCFLVQKQNTKWERAKVKM